MSNDVYFIPNQKLVPYPPLDHPGIKKINTYHAITKDALSNANFKKEALYLHDPQGRPGFRMQWWEVWRST